MKIYLSADKDGFDLKEVIKAYLQENDFNVVDLAETPAEDFVESANNLAAKITEDETGAGILIDAYGAGSFMAATKHKGIVVAEISEEWSANMTRRHNNARVISIGSEIVGEGLALGIVKAFADSEYDGGRHQIRVDMLDAMC